MVLCLQQILQKEEITKSLDDEAVKAPAIQNEKAHDDIDEPPLDNTLADDEYCKEEITKSLHVEAVKAPAIQKETAHDDTEPPLDNVLLDDWSDAANCKEDLKKESLENDVSDKPEEHKVPGQKTLLCCCNQWFLIGFPFKA